MAIRRRTLGVVVLAAATACNQKDNDISSASTSEVPVITVTSPGRWLPSQAWKVEPHLVVGQRTGPAEYTFNRIQALDVDREGRIYILDAGSYGVKVFDADGHFLKVFGRQGGGPGEFQNEWGVVGLKLFPDNRVGVYDFLMGKLAVFSWDDERAVTYQLSVPRRPLGPRPSSITALSGSDDVIIHLVQGFSQPPQPNDNTHLIILAQPEATSLDTLFTYSGPEASTYVHGMRVYVFPKPLGRSWRFAVDPQGRIALGFSDQYQITVSNTSGEPIAELVRPDFARSLSDRERRELTASYPWGDGTDGLEASVQQAAERALSDLEWPDTWPAFDRLVFDSHGNLWVRQPIVPGRGVHDWHVYTDQLDFLGTIQTPEGLEVLKITDDFMYGRVTDDLDVPSVMVLRLVKPEPSL